MSQSSGEPVTYGLYAVLVHSGYSCHAGHYYCYVKVSDVGCVRWRAVLGLLGAGVPCGLVQVQCGLCRMFILCKVALGCSGVQVLLLRVCVECRDVSKTRPGI